MLKLKRMPLELIPIVLIICLPDIVVGFALILIPHLIANNLKKRCGVQLTAQCSRFDEESTPVFQYTYLGDEKEIKSKNKNVEAGEKRTVWINKDNPDEYILEGEKSAVVIILTIIGSMIMISSFIIMLSFLMIVLVETGGTFAD